MIIQCYSCCYYVCIHVIYVYIYMSYNCYLTKRVIRLPKYLQNLVHLRARCQEPRDEDVPPEAPEEQARMKNAAAMLFCNGLCMGMGMFIVVCLCQGKELCVWLLVTCLFSWDSFRSLCAAPNHPPNKNLYAESR